MPTGGGKSLTFQLPALLAEGVTLVVMPLLSLISDQLIHMKKFGVKAEAFFTNLKFERQRMIFDDILARDSDRLKIIYITPEKLSKSQFVFNRIKDIYNKGLLERIVIDEAHCVSQWGHDFRKDYLSLSELKQNFPEVPILALTATATESVRIDIIKQLKMSNDTLYFKSSFNRPNLFYEIKPKLTKKKILNDLEKMLCNRFNGQTGIIYCCSIKDTDRLAEELTSRGINCGSYHSKMSAGNRNDTQNKWMSNEILVIVATIAFGMGINKSNVRFVIHYSFSKVSYLSLVTSINNLVCFYFNIQILKSFH